MSEHQDHEAKADAVEQELDEMQERSGRLQDDIEDTGDDWERKKRDPAVPGAAGMPVDGDGSDGEDDAGDDPSAGELDFGKDEDVDPGGGKG